MDMFKDEKGWQNLQCNASSFYNILDLFSSL